MCFLLFVIFCLCNIYIVFAENPDLTSNIYIYNKIIDLNNELKTDEDFVFQISLKGKSCKYLSYYYVKDKDKEGILRETDSKGRFRLKDGCIAVFNNIPIGSEYEVKRIPMDNYIQLVPSGGVPAVGTFVGDDCQINFVSKYIEKDTNDKSTCTLHIDESLIFPEGFEIPYFSNKEFILKVNGVFWKNKDYYLINNDKVKSKFQTDDKGVLNIPINGSIIVEDIPIGKVYEIIEVPKEGWKTVNKVNDRGKTGDYDIYSTFVDSFVSLGVNNVIKGTEEDKHFMFNIFSGEKEKQYGYYLYDKNKNLISAEPSYTYIGGNFILNKDQIALFFDLDYSKKYSVKLIEQKNYCQVTPKEREGYFNKELKYAVEILKFVSYYKNKGDLVIKFSVEGAYSDLSKKFNFTINLKNDKLNLLDTYLCEYNGVSSYRKLKDNIYNIDLSSGDVFKIYDLPEDTLYSVKERDYTKDSYNTDESNTVGIIRSGENPVSFKNYYSVIAVPIRVVDNYNLGVSGAKLKLYNKEDILKSSWISNGGIHIENLTPDTYYIKEEVVPENYSKSEIIKFQVTDKGKILLKNDIESDIVNIINPIDTFKINFQVKKKGTSEVGDVSFYINLKGKRIPEKVSFKSVDGEKEVSLRDNIITFTLIPNDEIDILGIPYGCGYSVIYEEDPTIEVDLEKNAEGVIIENISIESFVKKVSLYPKEFLNKFSEKYKVIIIFLLIIFLFYAFILRNLIFKILDKE